MDNNTIGILRCMSIVYTSLIHPHFRCTRTRQVALFLLCMPILAAPLQAIAVLCRSDPPYWGMFIIILLLGFVLSGIPVYYITSRDEGTPSRIISMCHSFAQCSFCWSIPSCHCSIFHLIMGTSTGTAISRSWLGGCCHGRRQRRTSRDARGTSVMACASSPSFWIATYRRNYNALAAP